MVELKCENILETGDIYEIYIQGYHVKFTLGAFGQQLRPKGRVLSFNNSWNGRQDKRQYILFYFNAIYLCFSSSLSPDGNTQRGHNHRGRTRPRSCRTPEYLDICTPEYYIKDICTPEYHNPKIPKYQKLNKYLCAACVADCSGAVYLYFDNK